MKRNGESGRRRQGRAGVRTTSEEMTAGAERVADGKDFGTNFEEQEREDEHAGARRALVYERSRDDGRRQTRRVLSLSPLFFASLVFRLAREIYEAQKGRLSIRQPVSPFIIVPKTLPPHSNWTGLDPTRLGPHRLGLKPVGWCSFQSSF